MNLQLVVVSESLFYFWKYNFLFKPFQMMSLNFEKFYTKIFLKKERFIWNDVIWNGE